MSDEFQPQHDAPIVAASGLQPPAITICTYTSQPDPEYVPRRSVQRKRSAPLLSTSPPPEKEESILSEKVVLSHHAQAGSMDLPAYTLPAHRRAGNPYMPRKRPWLRLFVYILLIAFAAVKLSNPKYLEVIIGAPTCKPYWDPSPSSSVPVMNHVRRVLYGTPGYCKNGHMFDLLTKHGNEQALPWASHKTILLLGDSVSQEHVESTCDRLGHRWQAIDVDEAQFMPDVNSPGQSQGSPDSTTAAVRESPISQARRTNIEVERRSGATRVCYVPEQSLLLVAVLHYGLDTDDYWADSGLPQVNAPVMFEKRVSAIAQRAIEQTAGLYNLPEERRSTVDLVELSLGSWDLARWAREDIENQQDSSAPLASDRLAWFSARANDAMTAVRDTFPTALSYLVRAPHYPIDQAQELAYFSHRVFAVRPGDSAPEYFAYNRIEQLESSLAASVEESPFHTINWGAMTRGHETHFRDRWHGNPFKATALWMDMVLYELWLGFWSN